MNPPIKSLCVFHLEMSPGEFHTNVLSLKVQQGIHIMHMKKHMRFKSL